MNNPLYHEWLLAVSSRLQMELTRPLNILTGFTTSLLKGDPFYFPFKGLLLFFEDWINLLPIYISLTFPLLLVQSAVRLFVYLLLLPVNMLLLTTTCGPLGLSAAIGITSTESSSISQQITDHLLQADSIKQAKYNALFDHILCLTGNEKIVFPGKLQRVVPSSPSSELFNLAGYAVFIYRLITWNSIKLLPIIGGPWLAYRSLIHDGNERLKRLHRLQRLRGRQIEYYYMKEREGELVSMGIVMWILEGIPVIGSLFEFTDRVGIAYKCGTELSSIT